MLATGQAMPDRKGRRGGNDGSRSSQSKWKLRREGSHSANLSLFTITEEEEIQRQRNAFKRKKKGMTGKERWKLTGM